MVSLGEEHDQPGWFDAGLGDETDQAPRSLSLRGGRAHEHGIVKVHHQLMERSRGVLHSFKMGMPKLVLCGRWTCQEELVPEETSTIQESREQHHKSNGCSADSRTSTSTTSASSPKVVVLMELGPPARPRGEGDLFRMYGRRSSAAS